MAIYQSLILTQQSQDVLSNKSAVRILWQSQQTGTTCNYVDHTAYYWVSINGGEETKYSVVYELPQYTNQTILDVTIEVPHDELGNGLVSVRTWMDPFDNGNARELSKELELTPIARARTIVASNADIGSTALIVVDLKTETFTHSIEYRFGQLSGYIANAVGDTSEEEVKLTAQNIGFPVPVSFYSQIPDDPSGECTLICRTYSGDTIIGTPQIATFTARANADICRPIVEGSVEDGNAETIALTGNKRILINGYSTARCSVVAEARESAGLVSVMVNNIPIDRTVEIPNVETGVFSFVATDSREYIGTDQENLQVIPFFPMTGVLTGQRKGPTSYEADIVVEGDWFNNSFGAVDNTLTAKYRVTDGNYVEMAVRVRKGESTYTASATIPDLDYTKNHTIEVLVEDCLSSVTLTVLIKKGIPVFNWGENNFDFHVPVTFRGGIVGLGDIAYPIGSIYLSVTESDPARLFGGTWERLKDVFLLAAGDAYKAGNTGGEAEHTLTVDEMPRHSHSVPAFVETTAGTGAFDYFRSNASDQNTGTLDAGGGKAHNNMPPYLAVYAWKRTG